MRRFLIAPLAALALAAAGCGGDTEPAAPAASTPSTSTPAEAAPADANAVEIGMVGLEFTPRDVTVKVGTKVTFKNNEDIPHNVVAEKGADFASDTFGKDGTFVYEATKAGTITYVCTIHPGMGGTLTVEG